MVGLGWAKPNPKKQKKRKRCRYERKHSLSLVHADYLEHDGVQVIAYEDDASRKILSIGEFTNAITDNAPQVLKEANLQHPDIIIFMVLSDWIGVKHRMKHLLEN